MPKNLSDLLRLIVAGFVLLFGLTMILVLTFSTIIFIISH